MIQMANFPVSSDRFRNIPVKTMPSSLRPSWWYRQKHQYRSAGVNQGSVGGVAPEFTAALLGFKSRPACGGSYNVEPRIDPNLIASYCRIILQIPHCIDGIRSSYYRSGRNTKDDYLSLNDDEVSIEIYVFNDDDVSPLKLIEAMFARVAHFNINNLCQNQ